MSEIKVDTLTGKTTANDITVTVGASATQSLEQGLTKAYFVIDQRGSLLGSAGTVGTDTLGVSSVADTTTGKINATMSIAMTTADQYVIDASTAYSAVTANATNCDMSGIFPTSTTAFAVHNSYANASLRDGVFFVSVCGSVA